jgi:2-polyprenyl-3-methyl-5-hydroxy-6-metoxy-1,4-benzoquinol methylase
MDMSQGASLQAKRQARYFHRENPPPIDTAYTAEELDLTPWYYSIELKAGEITNGQAFLNVGLTRELLRRTSITGTSCLDIGTMEGLIPVLMKRQGAARVVAYDRPKAFMRRIEEVKTAYAADFEFVAGVPLEQLPSQLDHKTFDVITMSGVLYHLFSPFSGLAIARGMLRNGGLMIIETAAVIDDDLNCMHWNNGDRFTGEAYFLPTTSCLDYLIRFLRMTVEDCIYIDTHCVDGLRLARVALACRAHDRPEETNDPFISGTLHTEVDMAEHLSWNRCRSSAEKVRHQTPSMWLFRRKAPAILRAARRLTRVAGYHGLSQAIDKLTRWRGHQLYKHKDIDSIDISKFCRVYRAHAATARDATLMLDDQS